MQQIICKAKFLFGTSKKIAKVAMVSTKSYDIESFNRGLATLPMDQQIEIDYLPNILNDKFASSLKGYDTICPFVNDKLNAQVLQTLHENGVTLIALRCAGFNNVDLNFANQFDMKVVRVPAYSPQAVAEHAVALLQSINRKIHLAHMRTIKGNFSIEGFTGFDLYHKTVGIVGFGNIGKSAAQIFNGFGMKVLIHDSFKVSKEDQAKYNVTQVDKETIFKESDVLTLHCPLTPELHHFVNKNTLKLMKHNAIIINTGRGGLVNANDVIQAIKAKEIGGIGLDVYEKEQGLFFNDLSTEIIPDDDLMRLMTFPNVVLTSHQAFLTNEALNQISNVTLHNIIDIRTTGKSKNIVLA